MLISASGFENAQLEVLKATVLNLGGDFVNHNGEVNICKRADQQNSRAQNVTQNWIAKSFALKKFAPIRRFKPFLHGIKVHLLDLPKKILSGTGAIVVSSKLAEVTITTLKLVKDARLSLNHAVVTIDWMKAVKRSWVAPELFVSSIKQNFLKKELFLGLESSSITMQLSEASEETYLKKKIEVESLISISDQAVRPKLLRS